MRFLVMKEFVHILTGLSTGIAPMYLSEVAPINLRGAAGTIHQFAIVAAVLVSQILGQPQLLGTKELWPLVLGKLLKFERKSPPNSQTSEFQGSSQKKSVIEKFLYV